jgi:hypothetical protein
MLMIFFSQILIIEAENTLWAGGRYSDALLQMIYALLN